jgi:hypothetical protein
MTWWKVSVLFVALMFFGMMGLNISHAELYRWVDENGTPCFTNDSGKIPDEYRSQVFGPDSAVENNASRSSSSQNAVSETSEKESKIHEN